MRTSRLLLASGLCLGAAIAILGAFIPGGGRLEQAEAATEALGDSPDLALDAPGPFTSSAASRPLRDRDPAL